MVRAARKVRHTRYTLKVIDGCAIARDTTLHVAKGAADSCDWIPDKSIRRCPKVTLPGNFIGIINAIPVGLKTGLAEGYEASAAAPVEGYQSAALQSALSGDSSARVNSERNDIIAAQIPEIDYPGGFRPNKEIKCNSVAQRRFAGHLPAIVNRMRGCGGSTKRAQVLHPSVAAPNKSMCLRA